MGSIKPFPTIVMLMPLYNLLTYVQTGDGLLSLLVFGHVWAGGLGTSSHSCTMGHFGHFFCPLSLWDATPPDTSRWRPNGIGMLGLLPDVRIPSAVSPRHRQPNGLAPLV